MGKYDKDCKLCGTVVMLKGEIKKDFSTETFNNKKVIICKECKQSGKSIFV